MDRCMCFAIEAKTSSSSFTGIVMAFVCGITIKMDEILLIKNDSFSKEYLKLIMCAALPKVLFLIRGYFVDFTRDMIVFMVIFFILTLFFREIEISHERKNKIE